MQQSRIAVPPSKEVNTDYSQARDTPRVTRTFDCCFVKRMQKKKMCANHRVSTLPIFWPTSSSTANRPRSTTPGTSSERGSISSDETPRTSFTDEAQTSYNILLILRNDTQHLISLRNENLAALEDNSALTEDAASARAALLACINESITAATRSVTQLGPFLDKHRWPAAGRPATPESQRRSFPMALKPRRRRSKSASGLDAGPQVTEDGESILSPEELFSWTLALTAQHTAVLVATKRLGTFLESGIANVSEEERRRREARASWWEQGRGGFENVGLIQSLLGRPKRTFGEPSAEGNTTVTIDATPAKTQGDDGEAAENLTPIMENDDGRSETLFSEAFTPSTMTMTPKGLTPRPRNHRMGSLQHEEGFCVRRVVTEALVYSSPGTQMSNETRLSRMETFGSEIPTIPVSRFSSSKQRPRIATLPLPSVVSWQNAPPKQPSTEQEPEQGTTGLSASQPTLTSLPSQIQKAPSPTPSPGAETEYTPYTPFDPNFTSLFTQRALSLPTSKTLQPVIQELDHMVGSPDPRAENIALRVSPVEAKSRVSIAPVIEGPELMVVSPVETESGTLTQPLPGVSPVTITETSEQASQEGADGHVAWLVYMERKRDVAASRWSLRRTKTGEI